MNRRQFLGQTLGMAMSLPLAGGAAWRSRKRLNVLFIAVDDLRPTLGCYGDPITVTPHIDALAEEGLLFQRAYCQQAVCGPSRMSLLTGRRPDAIRTWSNSHHFRQAIPTIVTLPQYFKKHGYHTQCVGKIFHGQSSMQDRVSWSVPEKHNFVHKGMYQYRYALEENQTGKLKARATECAEVPDNAYLDGLITEEAGKALNRNRERPFFLAVGFKKPHVPFCAPKKYWDLYDRKRLAVPEHPDPPRDVPPVALHNWKELRGYTDIPNDGPLSAKKSAELRHGYYAATSYVDAQVGKLLAKLDALGLRQNTVVILWGDHGYHLGEHDLWCKTTNFELDTHVPLILSVPSQQSKGRKTRALVELVDIYPTLVECCRLPIPDDLDGVSMVPLLKDPDRSWKKTAFSQFPRPAYYKRQPEVMGYSMRTDRFRYTQWQNWKTATVVAQELYDHGLDPHETRNLALKKPYRGIVKELSTLLNKQKKKWSRAQD
jgi:iduronate 2-sulfatase